MTRTVDLEKDKYMVQTRSQAKSSGVNVPEVHSVNKGLIRHVKPEKSVIVRVACPIPPTCHLRPVHHTPSTDQRLPTNAVPPLPKLRVGQGRTGIRRKTKGNSTITKPDPRTAQPIA